MSNDLEPLTSDDGREITAKFDRDELVRGWRSREPRIPRWTPVLRVAAKTDLGRIRENNEDKFDFYEPEDPSILAARGSFYAVADGMGGHAAGQIASELALKTVISCYYDGAADSIPNALLESLVAANDTVHGVASMVPDRNGMGTTLTSAVFIEDRVFIGQVGDSRAYLIRAGSIRKVTFDHSWVEEQVRMGGMSLEEAQNSPYRNVITRCIGALPAVEPDVFEELALPGDIWVLCSDGLTGHVEDSEILKVAAENPPSETARQLIELANARGGRDNITVFVISVRDVLRGDTHDDEASASSSATGPLRPERVPEEPRGIRKVLFGK